MKMRKNLRLTLGALLFTVLIHVIFCMSPGSGKTEGQVGIGRVDTRLADMRPIESRLQLAAPFPIVIDQPGNYTLAKNLTVFTTGTCCIEIKADDVTLDLQGNIITGPGSDGISNDASTGIGICAFGRKNIEIVNGTVQGFSCGISLSGKDHQVKGISTLYNRSCGIDAESSLIDNCRANYNGSDGIRADSSTIINCTADFNGSCGLHVESSTVIDCTAHSNGSHGLYAVDKCLLEGNIILENGGYGIYLDHDYSYAIKNVSSQNAAGNFHQTGVNYLPASSAEVHDETNSESID
ncbi:MAG: right-handed parallel beta-helix repeat-containing protein [bacterium]